MRIEHYSFGRISIDGTLYTSDVIIYPDRVDASWWRKEGHYLQKVDLADIVAAGPELLIVGTGAHGVMAVPDSTIAYLSSHNIALLAEKTDKAVELFNNQPPGKKVIAALHLTC
ncbi:MAG: hypothetical protein FIA94_04155 [Nitrospirae bacterium]|nr:hypothetical protein [Nitrospirota bacterium]